MSTLDDAGLFQPPARLRHPVLWVALAALLLLLLGLMAIALPDTISGPVIWSLLGYGIHLADGIGLTMLASGSGMIWIVSLIRQWQFTH